MNSAKPARVPIAGKKKISERSRYERIDKVRFGLIYKRLLAFRYPNECFSLHRTKRVLAQCTNLEAQTRTQCMYIGITHDTHVLCMCVCGGGGVAFLTVKSCLCRSLFIGCALFQCSSAQRCVTCATCTPTFTVVHPLWRRLDSRTNSPGSG